MKKAHFLIAAGALVLAALACGGPTPAPPTAIPPTPVPPTIAPPTVAPSGEAELVLENASGIPVCFVYISPTESDEWGENWLATDEVVRSGHRRTFGVPEGSYDLIARDCDGNPVSEAVQGQPISGEITWTISP